MRLKIIINILFLINSLETKEVTQDTIKKSLEQHQGHILVNKSKLKNTHLKIANVTKVKIKTTLRKTPDVPTLITRERLKQWAYEIHEHLFEIEKKVVRRDVLSQSFSNIKIEMRNGSAILQRASRALEGLLDRRGKAAEAIMRKAEELSTYILENKKPPPPDYMFDHSVDLDVLKQAVPTESEWELPSSCISIDKVKLQKSSHFNAQVSLDFSSVHVVAEVFACDHRVLPHIYWSENLLATFRENYAQDATLDFQYLCSAKGFLRHYPAALWQSLYNLNVEAEDVYDCRLRPWYVSASGAPRDVLILLDASGSMDNSSNQVIAELFTSTLLNALTDDDQVNVLRFNVVVESPISCFNDKLVPANHVNSAAMMSALKRQALVNESLIGDVLTYSVHLLQKQNTLNRPRACQQAIVLVTDSLYYNYTDLMRRLDPEGKIRLFVMWLHDRNGLRDYTRLYGESVSCERDGYFAEFISHSDITEQVMRILRVLERPLVAQREHRLRTYSDVYAHIEDPRRGEFHWQQKESAEQEYRYKRLRQNKDLFLKNLYKDDMHLYNLDKKGQYYEGEDMNYRLQVSVSVPVFESTTIENITIKLDEENQRNATRTYPVNRLLGVAGVDIPLDHLKLILPFFLIGASGTMFIVDHRGNIVLHNNTKPVFDGDILKPGYRTVDILDVEQPGIDHYPRHYPQEWLDFRQALVIDEPNGSRSMYAKSIFEGGMRAIIEVKDYHWQRIHDHYTLVVSLPKYNLLHAVPDGKFTQELGEEAYKALWNTDFAIHPEWLYCRHVEPHFDSRKFEILHFLRRRKDEPNFAMQKIKHIFTAFPQTLLEKTYHCNEELMARLSHEAVSTKQWALEHEDPDTDRECSGCLLGSNTAFFATESGLTRWQLYHATTAHADPPEGSVWSLGPDEPFYRRATANPDTLVIHAPIPPVRLLRNTDASPPALDERWQWLTAARTLGHPTKHGIIGVAGYHFYPRHLDDLLDSITNFHCNEEDESKCEPRCDNDTWACLLIDEAGWVIADQTEDERINKHLSTEHPAAMKALLDAGVFRIRWVHDYQGVCFPPEDEKAKAASTRLPSIIISLWSTIKIIIYASHNILTLFYVMMSNTLVSCDTETEKKKRRERIRHDYEREKFERLFDPKVILNRTRFAACDRTRAIYELQQNKNSMEALNRPAEICEWPLVVTEVPRTNLLLLAVFKSCNISMQLNDSLYNEPVVMEQDGEVFGSASRLACWRNRIPLPARQPHTTCYPHNFTSEEGYRKCGPWLPDPENDANSLQCSKIFWLLFIHIVLYLI
ncbi:voltage-dependent calcium channel subunit alpha-2/delta-4-like [Pieris brassicae]|uniref:voltage-dependent calcium channel subunit alpha-2/delta-4-like n=1 Tax=Pieris brassicae TaxID=7116 RepID=UPI001E65F701|nr:voltage-dependent calcium channel subunit alpha-2/delta-4-like [Pieris brassicae]